MYLSFYKYHTSEAMKLKKMRFINFRGYKDCTFDFSNLTAIIGKNDVGKSTILEALDLFFNYDNKDRQVVCLDNRDLNVLAEEEYFEIICYFQAEYEEKIIIDSTNQTTLEDEYLLNSKGELEIHMKFDCSKKSLAKANISINIRAYIPYLEDKEFITMKIKDLKQELDKIKDEIDNYDQINKTVKAEIRKALYQYYSQDTVQKEANLSIKEIETDNSDLWKTINKSLPAFFLFQSDRTNTSKDSEIQNPLKIALVEAVEKHTKSLEEIEKSIIEEVSEVGDATIEKLNEFDKGIAKGLKTHHETKKWDSLFTLTIEDDRDIPLEKRGSGIRRLILLSYFMVEAERQMRTGSVKNIIYAIEEPETSQHPNYQVMIMDSLKQIVNNSENQVIITTHTPEIAKLLRDDELIFIDRLEYNFPQVISDPEEKKIKIKESLGILPTINSKLLICVEGENDVNFLRNINSNIIEFKELIDLTEYSIFPMKGSNLQQWIDHDYLNGTDVKEFHLYDSDVQSYIDQVEEMNIDSDGRRCGLNTKLPEMENYIPIDLIENQFEIKFDSSKDWKKEDIPEYLKDKAMLHIENPKKRESAIKGILNNSISKNITKKMLEEYGVYNEIKSWFTKMAEWSE